MVKPSRESRKQNIGLTEDELIDSLPLHLQNQVLNSIEVMEDGTVRRKRPKEHSPLTPKILLALILSVLWAIPWTIIGLLICLTIILAPIGVACIFLGCIPLAVVICRWQAKYVR